MTRNDAALEPALQGQIHKKGIPRVHVGTDSQQRVRRPLMWQLIEALEVHATERGVGGGIV